MCHKNQFPVASCQSNCVNTGAPPVLNVYFLFDADFLAAFLGAAFFLACPLADFAPASDSCSSSCAGAAFFTLGCLFTNSGALKLCPSKAISVMRTAV